MINSRPVPNSDEYVDAPSGGNVFGLMEGAEVKAAGLPLGEIRLQVGYGGPKGFGLAHVESYADRIKTLVNLGFRDFPHFCEFVARKYTRVGKGDNGRTALIMPHEGYEIWLIVEFKNGENAHWTIVTGVVSRRCRCETVCEVMRTDGSEPTPNVAKRTRFETLSLPKKTMLASNGS